MNGEVKPNYHTNIEYMQECFQKQKEDILRQEKLRVENNLDMSQTTISETDEYQPIYPPTEAEEKERAQYVKR